MGPQKSDDAVGRGPGAVARPLARYAPDQRRHADAGIAAGARHQTSEFAVAAGRHRHALHRQQPVRSGAGDGRHRAASRTTPARRDLGRSRHRSLDRAGAKAEGAAGGLTWITSPRCGIRVANLKLYIIIFYGDIYAAISAL